MTGSRSPGWHSPERKAELTVNAHLLRAWRKWHREQLEQALEGPHGAMVGRLMVVLKSLTEGSAPLLLAYIHGVDWSTVDHPTRLTALHEISTAIVKLRERNGLSPFDDGLPGERDNMFRVVRSILLSAEAAPPGAHAGLT